MHLKSYIKDKEAKIIEKEELGMNKMKKLIIASTLGVTALSLAFSFRTISAKQSDEHIPFFAYKYGNCGMGPISAFFDVNVVVYEDNTISIYTNNAEVRKDDSVVVEEEYTISQKDFDEIYDAVKHSKLYKRNKVRCDRSVCDGSNSYMTFYNSGEELVTLGGYCVKNRKYDKLRETVFEVIDMDDEIYEIRNKTEEILEEE